MADYSSIPSGGLPDLGGILSSSSFDDNDDTKKVSKKKSEVGNDFTSQQNKNVDKALAVHAEGEKERESTPLSTPPKLTEAPKPEDYQTNPMEKFGSAGSLLATLGSLMTRKPLTNALNAGAAVNNAINEGDSSKFKTAFDTWKINNENAWRMSDWQEQHYNDIMKRIDAKESGAEEELRLAAIKFKDPTLEHAIQVGEYRQLLQTMAEKSTKAKEAAQDSTALFDSYHGKLEEFKAKNGRDANKQEAASFWQSAKSERDSAGADFGKNQQASDEKAAYKDAYDKAITEGKNDTQARMDGERARGGVVTAAKGSAMKGVPSISEETADFVARQFIASGGKPSTLTGWGRGESASANLSMIHNKIPQIAKELGLKPEDLVNLDLQMTKLRAEEQTLGHQTAKVNSAGEEFDTISDQVIETSDKVDRTQYKSLNSVIEAVEAGTGDENVIALYAAVLGASNTYARAINPNGVGRIEDQSHFMKAMNEAYSKGQIKTAVNQFKKETEAARAAPPKVQKAINKQLKDISSGNKSDDNVVHWDDLK